MQPEGFDSAHTHAGPGQLEAAPILPPLFLTPYSLAVIQAQLPGGGELGWVASSCAHTTARRGAGGSVDGASSCQTLMQLPTSCSAGFCSIRGQGPG